MARLGPTEGPELAHADAVAEAAAFEGDERDVVIGPRRGRLVRDREACGNEAHSDKSGDAFPEHPGFYFRRTARVRRVFLADDRTKTTECHSGDGSDSDLHPPSTVARSCIGWVHCRPMLDPRVCTPYLTMQPTAWTPSRQLIFLPSA